MKTLDEIAIKCGTDKSTVHATAHGYAPHYDRFFQPMRMKPIKMLEIGVGGGESINTWLEYFPNAFVHGVDLQECQRENVKHPRFKFTCGDQSDPAFWQQFITENGGAFDLIIDDGGHFSGGIITSFEAMWPQVRSGGIYAIEDLACAYSSIFQTAGFQNHIEFVKTLVDHANKGEREIDRITVSKELAVLFKS